MMNQKYLVPIFSSSLSYSIAILLTFAIDRWDWPSLYIYIAGFLGVLAATIYAVFTEKKHIEDVEKTARNIQTRYEITHSEYIRENRNLCELIVKSELERIATRLTPGVNTIRSNIFLCDETDNKLYIAYNYGMENAPDLSIRLDLNAGCAGHAYHFGEVAVASLLDPVEKQLRVEWKLENDQIAVTRHLKAILAIPVRHPINHQQVIGVLNLDSTDPISSTFEEVKFQEQVQYHAFLISAFIWLGNIIKR